MTILSTHYHRWRWLASSLLFAIMGIQLSSSAASAHDWYPIECCRANDCAEVEHATYDRAPNADTKFPILTVTTKHGTALVPENFPHRKITGWQDACVHAPRPRRHAPDLFVRASPVLSPAHAYVADIYVSRERPVTTPACAQAGPHPDPALVRVVKRPLSSAPTPKYVGGVAETTSAWRGAEPRGPDPAMAADGHRRRSRKAAPQRVTQAIQVRPRPYGPLGGFLANSERRLADLDTSG